MGFNTEKCIVELVRENPTSFGFFNTELELPATEMQMRDALHKARWMNADSDYREIYFINCPLVPELVNVQINNADIKEINFFAKRLEKLSEEDLIVLNAVIEKNLEEGKYKDGISPKELINQTYGLDNVMIVSNVNDDEALGQFVIENELHEDVAAVPDNALYLLDKKRIGELQRKIDGGVFIEGHYVVTGTYELPKVYDGEYLPNMKELSDTVFRLKASQKPMNDSDETGESNVWIELPINNEKLNKIIDEHFNVCRIEQCVYFDFESAIPMIDDEMFGDMRDFNVLNSIAEKYLHMNEDDRIKYKAVLEGEKVSDLKEALNIAENISDYELAYCCLDESEFFIEHLLNHMDKGYDPNWLANLVVRDEGIKLIEKLDAKSTNYGIVSARGIPLYSLVEVDEEQESMNEDSINTEEEETQNLGGMQL